MNRSHTLAGIVLALALFSGQALAADIPPGAGQAKAALEK